MRRHHTTGFTLIELLMVVAIIGIIAAIAIPGLLRSRQSANEASAIASMRSISSAQSAYAASCGCGYYATTLEDLALAAARRQPLRRAGPGDDRHRQERLHGDDGLGRAGARRASRRRATAGALGTGYHATAIPLPGAGAREFGTNTTGVDLLRRACRPPSRSPTEAVGTGHARSGSAAAAAPRRPAARQSPLDVPRRSRYNWLSRPVRS